MDEEDSLPERGEAYATQSKAWAVAEVERKHLSLRPDADGRMVDRFIDAKIVSSSSKPENTVEIALHHQKLGKNGLPAGAPLPLTTLKTGEWVRLTLDSDDTLALYRHLQNLYAIGRGGVPQGTRSLVAYDQDEIVATGEPAALIKGLLEAHDQADVLAAIEAVLPDPLATLALKREHARRASALAEFERHLGALDWDERAWQRFFRRNDWIFGHGLDYHFLVNQQPEPQLGGGDLTGSGGQRGDELMSTAGNWRFAVLVELKRPDTELLGDHAYRNGAWAIGRELSGGMAQLQAACERVVISAQVRENTRLLDARRMSATDPKGILLIGNTHELDDDAKRATFHRFRRNIWNPEVLTYDELLARARFLVQRADPDAQSAAPFDDGGPEQPDDIDWGSVDESPPDDIDAGAFIGRPDDDPPERYPDGF